MRNERTVRLLDSPTLEYESRLWAGGYNWIAGLDEAGRGALAGPVAVGAVILPPKQDVLSLLSGVRDSKQMTPRERERWAEKIRQCAISYAVGLAVVREIDEMGIVPAIWLAARRALEQLSHQPDALLLDYLTIPDYPVPQISLVHGDCISLSIASASVLAKTTRDKYMVSLKGKYPQYGFEQHKGYGTLAHRRAIQYYGVTTVHRKCFSFKPVDK